MQITTESLDENLKALRAQQDQGLALFHQASGAIQLVEALKAQLADALTERQLTDIIETPSV